MSSANATGEFPPVQAAESHSMTGLAHSGRSWMIVALAVAGTVAFQFYLWPHITDDAYISFRYAFHFAQGQGLVFNPGERVEGFSNPLWTLLLGFLFGATGVSIPDLARGLGLGCTLGTLFCIRTISVRLSPADLKPLIFTILFLMFTPGFHVYATAGLEGPLLSFLLVLGMERSLRDARRSAAIIFGLAGITRPEAPLLALLWFLATIEPRAAMKEMIRREVPPFVIMILPILAWQIFRLAYYGSWFPNTALAKVPGVFAEFINLPEYLTPWLIALGGPLIILLWLIRPPNDHAARSFERAGMAIAGGMAVFVVYAGGDWMSFGRFIEPVWPLLALVCSLWLRDGWQDITRLSSLRFRKLIPFVPAAGIVACSIVAWYPSVRSYIRNEKMNMLMKGSDQIAVGNWISANITRDATIATGRLGGISYGAINNVVWDWFGLTDAAEARHIRKRRPGSLEDDPVFGRNPDVIAAIDAPANWSYKRTAPLLHYLDSSYVFTMSFPQGTYGSVDLWLRRSRLDQIFRTRSQYVLPLPADRQ